MSKTTNILIRILALLIGLLFILSSIDQLINTDYGNFQGKLSIVTGILLGIVFLSYGIIGKDLFFGREGVSNSILYLKKINISRGKKTGINLFNFILDYDRKLHSDKEMNLNMVNFSSEMICALFPTTNYSLILDSFHIKTSSNKIRTKLIDYFDRHQTKYIIQESTFFTKRMTSFFVTSNECLLEFTNSFCSSNDLIYIRVLSKALNLNDVSCRELENSSQKDFEDYYINRLNDYHSIVLFPILHFPTTIISKTSEFNGYEEVLTNIGSKYGLNINPGGRSD